ncbi:ubiquinol-cytochrome c reductase iron-sulfur subunit N-terminal domain-containing protein [Sedimentitalea nanhaiensis]|uniref:Formate dehydrogenase region TAT target n=1 Tax=Sedimentitalea nanhaiensis TaxID=999627 RepID=A0A1I7ASG8_9RHOB|nr:ubiquinol-cytochrome c reductase iron-sulfur subunit N-terminal domain-containing protein [Sedimentitalea nanhaiensis]SFT77837.1 formate dehydrogenase region TAT target [Sedimentitalea nanhaiensis]
MRKKQKDDTSRRDFLKLAGTAAPAAVAAAALSGSDAEAAALPVDETRLQDTAHTRAYLNSARF